MARTLASDGWVHHLPFHHVEFQRHNYFVLDTISLFLSFSSFSLIRTRTCVRSSASCLGSVSVPVAYLGMGRAWGSGAVETHQQKEHIRTLGRGRRKGENAAVLFCQKVPLLQAPVTTNSMESRALPATVFLHESEEFRTISPASQQHAWNLSKVHAYVEALFSSFPC